MNPCPKHNQKKGCREEHDAIEVGKTQDVEETSRRAGRHKGRRSGEVVQVAPKDLRTSQGSRQFAPQVGSVPEVCGCHRRDFKVRAMEGHFPL